MPALRRRKARQLALPATDLAQLRARVRALAENRPGVYEMVDQTGKILYVGKAKRLRTRLLCYFRADYPADKAARILYAAHDIRWSYVPSEFAALLTELRRIRQYRPHFNYKFNRTRRSILIKISGGAAPRMSAGQAITAGDEKVYGPYRSLARTIDAVRTLNDLLGLRDCAATMPILFSGQGDLFGGQRQAGCPRHEFGSCTGPCAGFISEWDYRKRLEIAAAFLEGRTIQPIDRVVEEMTRAAGEARFELAARWRERFEQLEWLLAATSRARSALDLLSFVYRDPGDLGDDRVYVVRQGLVRSSYPWPSTPIEHEAFSAIVAEEAARPAPITGSLPLDSVDEILLVHSWFRVHPDALKRTTALGEWTSGAPSP